MRKLYGIAAAGMMSLALASPAMAGPNVGNSSGSATVAQAGWSDYDEATSSYVDGYLAVGQESGYPDAWAEFYQYQESWVQCTGAETPDDPDDDSFGVVVNYTSGWGSATLKVGRNSSTAVATGLLEVYEGSFNECTGEETYVDSRAVEFSMDLTATSGAIKETGRGSWHLPSEFNSHYSFRSTYRAAEGTVTLGETFPVFGQIGKVSWMDHTNS